MLTSMLDEYRFHNFYPAKALKIAGRLYGSCILNGILEGNMKDVALNIILEVLTLDYQSKKIRVNIFF